MIYYKTEDGDSVFECPNSADWDIDDFAADMCAIDYHSHHDGWESAWPLKFSLALTEGSQEWKVFDVEREYDPTFSAREAQDGGEG